MKTLVCTLLMVGAVIASYYFEYNPYSWTAGVVFGAAYTVLRPFPTKEEDK